MNRFWQDVRFEVRSLARAPVALVVMVLTFGLGIGLNTTIFGVIKALWLRPLPGTAQPENLTVVASRTNSGQLIPLSYPIFKELRDRNEVFATLAASAMTPITLTTGGAGTRIWGELVSGTYFASLGTRVALGRPVLPSDDVSPGTSPVAVISYGLWQTRFGGDPHVVGQPIALNGHPFTIIGVTERAFRGSLVGLSFDVFVPLTMQADVFSYDVHGNLLEQPDTSWLIAQGRLKPGISPSTAQAAMNVLGDQLMKVYPNDEMAQRAALVPLWRSPFGAQTVLLPIVSILMVAAMLVLLIACANIANVLLARATRRTGEIAVRLALGAGPWQLVRQLLTGSAVVALGGAAVGLAGAAWTSRLFVGRTGPNGVPVSLNAGVDAPVFIFALVVAMICAVVVGIVPAVRISRTNLASTLSREAGTRVVYRSWLTSTLVIGQIAVSLVLLISAALLVRSVEHAAAVDPGFNPQRALLVALDLKANGYDSGTGSTFARRMLQTEKALSGVEDATLTWQLPLSGGGPSAPSASVSVEGYAASKGQDDLIFHYNIVGPEYLRTMGIPLLDGRDFTTRDDAASLPVVIINDTMSRRFWHGRNPIGARLFTSGAWRTVVGVARDAKYLSMSEDPQPYLYLPYFQAYQPQVTLEVRTIGPPQAVQNAVQQSIQQLDAALPVLSVQTLERQVKNSLARVEQIAGLLTIAGLGGLLLAIIGVYGVMAQNVARELPAFGIRMALGAGTRDIFLHVIARGARLMLIGVALGIAVSLVGTRLLRVVLFGVSPIDPLTFGAMTLLVAIVVLAACWIPARRAAHLDPMETLRHS